LSVVKIFEFFEVLTLEMTLSAIIIIIFIINAPKYSNILIDKIGGLSLSELYPKGQLKKDIFFSSFRHLFALSKKKLKKDNF